MPDQQISLDPVLAGADVQPLIDLIPIVDMSKPDGTKNSTITVTELGIALQFASPSWKADSGATLTANNIISGIFNLSFTNTAVKFTSDNLRVRNPADTFEYTIGGRAITGNRTIDLPLVASSSNLKFAVVDSASAGTQLIPIGTSVSGVYIVSSNLSFVTGTNTLDTVNANLSGTLFVAASGTITGNTLADFRGTGTGTNLILRLADSTNTPRWSFQDNGILVSNSGSITGLSGGGAISLAAGQTMGSVSSQLQFSTLGGTFSGYSAYFNHANFTGTAGTQIGLGVVGTFAPTSGAAAFIPLRIINTVNQTGGANGLVSLISLEPTFTNKNGDVYGLRYSATVGTITGNHYAIGINTGFVLMGNNPASPTAGVANSTIMYSKDVAASSELFVMNELGEESQVTGALMIKKITVTAAQILNSFTVPIQIIAAVPGKIIVPIFYSHKIIYGGVAYATNTTTTYYINGNPVSQNHDISFTADKYRSVQNNLLTVTGAGAVAGLTNQPLMLATQVGNPTAGNSDIEITVTYYLV